MTDNKANLLVATADLCVKAIGVSWRQTTLLVQGLADSGENLRESVELTERAKKLRERREKPERKKRGNLEKSRGREEGGRERGERGGRAEGKSITAHAEEVSS